MPEPASELRHALRNPLSGILAEAQLLLRSGVPMDTEIRDGLRDIEQLALRMRDIMKESKTQDSQLADTPKEKD